MKLIITIGVIVLASLYLLHLIFRKSRQPGELESRLIQAGIVPGDGDRLSGSGVFWKSKKTLMTEREIHFMQALLNTVDLTRWYLCPQVRVADIVELSPRIRARSKTWWRLFNMVAQWHCDVVIVDRRTFEIVAGVELDDASHLKKHWVRRDILLNEVMRQAGVPLLRDRDSQKLIAEVKSHLKYRAAKTEGEV